MYREYSAEEYTKACRLLLEIRDDCLKSDGDNDTKRKEKIKALNIALDAIDRIDWHH